MFLEFGFVWCHQHRNSLNEFILVVYFLHTYVCRKYDKFSSCSARSNERQAMQDQTNETATGQIIWQSDEVLMIDWSTQASANVPSTDCLKNH